MPCHQHGFFRLFSRTYPTRHEQRACMPLFYFLFRFARSIHASLSPFAPFCHFFFSLRRWSDFEQSAATVAVSAAAVVFYYRRCRSFSAFATVSVAAALRLQLHAHAAAVDGSEGGRVFFKWPATTLQGSMRWRCARRCRRQAPTCFALRLPARASTTLLRLPRVGLVGPTQRRHHAVQLPLAAVAMTFGHYTLSRCGGDEPPRTLLSLHLQTRPILGR